MTQPLVFMECAACREKPGAPMLCESCLHNRAVIQTLRNGIDAVRVMAADIINRNAVADVVIQHRLDKAKDLLARYAGSALGSALMEIAEVSK